MHLLKELSTKFSTYNPFSEQLTLVRNWFLPSTAYLKAGMEGTDAVRPPQPLMMERVAPLIETAPAIAGRRLDGAPHEFRVRLVTWDDLPQIVQLEVLGYQGYVAWSKQDFERDWLHNPYGVYLVIDAPAGPSAGRQMAPGTLGSQMAPDAPSTQEAPSSQANTRPDRALAGLIMGRYRYKGAHISHVIVDPAYQGQGLAAGLVQVFLEGAASQGIRTAALEVRQTNQAAIKLYEKHGFSIHSELPNYYRQNHESAYYMVASLRPYKKGGVTGYER